jgi:hypothetical protein
MELTYYSYRTHDLMSRPISIRVEAERALQILKTKNIDATLKIGYTIIGGTGFDADDQWGWWINPQTFNDR